MGGSDGEDDVPLEDEGDSIPSAGEEDCVAGIGGTSGGAEVTGVGGTWWTVYPGGSVDAGVELP